MIITTTELKNNLDYYLENIENEDIFITENGKIIKKLENPNNVNDDLKYAYLKENITYKKVIF